MAYKWYDDPTDAVRSTKGEPQFLLAINDAWMQNYVDKRWVTLRQHNFMGYTSATAIIRVADTSSATGTSFGLQMAASPGASLTFKGTNLTVWCQKLGNADGTYPLNSDWSGKCFVWGPPNAPFAIPEADPSNSWSSSNPIAMDGWSDSTGASVYTDATATLDNTLPANTYIRINQTGLYYIAATLYGAF